MSEVTKEQKLQSEVITLKARLFDINDALAATQAQAQEFQQALSAIVSIVGIGKDGDSIELTSIVDAVKALVPEQLELAE